MSEIDERVKFARSVVIGLATAPDDKLRNARTVIERSSDLNSDMKRAVLTLIEAIIATGSNLEARAILVREFLNAIDELAEDERKKKRCFIATAACGTIEHDDVRILTRFRDEVLNVSYTGRLFIRFYEAVSPPLAGFISNRPKAKQIARRLIVSPARHIAEQLIP